MILSIGGWTHGTGGFSHAARNPTRFAKNALEFIEKYKFDGIDLDWEYPGYEDHPSKKGHKDDVALYVPFLQEVKKVFAPRGLLVTAAMGAYRVETMSHITNLLDT